jgi:hypothetical protein
MKRRRSTIPPRRRIFLGCEGPSEHAYGSLLSRLARDRQDIHVHIDVVHLNPEAGDPLALIDRASQEISRRERSGVPYAVKALLLDDDKMGQTAERDVHVPVRAAEGNVLLIWQRPVHEAFLLRHLEGCEALRPPKNRCLALLQRQWPAYSKPMTANKLAERITLVGIRRACTVEHGLEAFLRAVGWFG